MSRGIRCNRCQLISYSEDDINNKYCRDCGYIDDYDLLEKEGSEVKIVSSSVTIPLERFKELEETFNGHIEWKKNIKAKYDDLSNTLEADYRNRQDTLEKQYKKKKRNCTRVIEVHTKRLISKGVWGKEEYETIEEIELFGNDDKFWYKDQLERIGDLLKDDFKALSQQEDLYKQKSDAFREEIKELKRQLSEYKTTRASGNSIGCVVFAAAPMLITFILSFWI